MATIKEKTWAEMTQEERCAKVRSRAKAIGQSHRSVENKVATATKNSVELGFVAVSGYVAGQLNRPDAK